MKKAFVLVLVGLFTLLGTARAGKEKVPTVENVHLATRVPVLDTVPGYPCQQTKGEVSIQLLPVPIEAKVVYHKTVREKPKGMLSLGIGDTKPYIVTEEPAGYIFKPDTLIFQLHITNRMKHVLRFAGCLVSFNVDGKSLPIDQKTQEEFTKAILLPGGTLDLAIKGPQVLAKDITSDTTKTVLDTAKTVVFSVFDVTTEVDEANNPVKKATFEWIFANKSKIVSGDFQKTTQEQKLRPQEAAAMNDQWYFKEQAE